MAFRGKCRHSDSNPDNANIQRDQKNRGIGRRHVSYLICTNTAHSQLLFYIHWVTGIYLKSLLESNSRIFKATGLHI